MRYHKFDLPLAVLSECNNYVNSCNIEERKITLIHRIITSDLKFWQSIQPPCITNERKLFNLSEFNHAMQSLGVYLRLIIGNYLYNQ